jgi:hypothetical protein
VCTDRFVLRAGRSGMGHGRLSWPGDGTAGLPSAPEMPCAPRQLRLVPIPDLGGGATGSMYPPTIASTPFNSEATAVGGESVEVAFVDGAGGRRLQRTEKHAS